TASSAFMPENLTPAPNARSEQRATLSYLIFRSFPPAHDFQVKIQCKTRQRVIGIYPDQVAVNARHLNDLGLITGIGLKLHPDFQSINSLEKRTGNRANQVFTTIAVGHFRWHGHLQAIARHAVFYRHLKTLDDIRGAIQKMQRLTALGGVHQLADPIL